MNTDNVHRQTTEALRDFFIAKNSVALFAAYDRMTTLPGALLPSIESWDELEFSFNRLFNGPMALEAPPYASVYLDEEPLVMGKTTLMVRQVYEMLGLVSPWKNALPDDHVSLELDAALALNDLEQSMASPELRALRHFFLVEHVHQWVPIFCERIETAASAHPAIQAVAGLLRAWLYSPIARCPEEASIISSTTEQRGNHGSVCYG